MAEYVPRNVPDNVAEIPKFLKEEFARMREALNKPNLYLGLSVANVAPLKVFEGMTMLASGAPGWNPGGTGKGVYTYYNGVWNKLG